jgi:N-acetyl-gamma-glutamyl-phosphate reductase
MKTRVAVVGATGYAGAELVRILSGHPEIDLTLITSRQYTGTRFDAIYPHMTGMVDLVCEAFSSESLNERSDIVFLALPHKLPMAFVPELLKSGKRVIDLSADFRFQNAETYESFYQAHTAKDLLDTAVYGLCEVYMERIRNAGLIGNPGCYPTSVLLPLVPLLEQGLLDLQSIVVDSKSGVSGAGRSLSLTTHFCEANESLKAYKVAEHRHAPEIEEVLSLESGQPVKMTFVPHLVPMTRGMLSTIYVKLLRNSSEEAIRRHLGLYFDKRAFVRICSNGRLPDTAHVRGTNYCDIGVKIDPRTGTVILVSAIDNLVKGAAGQAVQNMNIMLGLEETVGLLTPPYPI